ncbi:MULTISPECIES: peptidoglycan-binding domain-containing protein [Oscillatoriophycideae]|uniref:Peptidoglycan-binding protein n=1 Tax=Aerosakkonema funiforme FACHB-1375 TaxID=2949571 RepID=A0A926ZJ76_9CYAN|nr:MULTISPECIES: peptidoglycan-binding domain-containing protein [Oscillatoriales]MBD2184072.1 peptidoglycan-binding protein [Aerosakkonema funiforme FACHB-1375]MBD3560144.1 peptidoglycan-binding protein [Planktothrix sp. FACHB-1355]
MQSVIKLETKSAQLSPTETLPVLRYGSYGDAVKIVQRLLFTLNYYSNVINGVYGLRTEAAVKSFQKDNGLVVNGIVDSKTWLGLSRISC